MPRGAQRVSIPAFLYLGKRVSPLLATKSQRSLSSSLVNTHGILMPYIGISKELVLRGKNAKAVRSEIHIPPLDKNQGDRYTFISDSRLPRLKPLIHCLLKQCNHLPRWYIPRRLHLAPIQPTKPRLAINKLQILVSTSFPDHESVKHHC